MEDRSTLTLTGALILIAASGMVLAFAGLGAERASVYYLLGLINVAVILLIVQDGTLFKSKIFKRLFFLSIAVTLTGVLWKIMHWYPGNYLLLAGFSAFILSYSARFFLKPEKVLFDYLKWGWVVSTCVLIVCKIFHWYPNVVVQLQSIFQLALMLAFLRKVMQQRSQLPREE